MKEEKTNILMVANWKMNPNSPEQALENFLQIKKNTKKYKHITTVVCPSAVHMGLFYKKTSENCLLGGQGGDVDDIGAKTGLVSLEQYKKIGAEYVILGHSEERARGLSSEILAQQIFFALKKGLVPIVCVGEEVRDSKGKYVFTIVNQIKEALSAIPKSSISKVVVAYEPLWAIGASAKRSANVTEVEEIAILIRRTIADMYSMKKVPSNKILYGGSVSDGSLVASLFENNVVQGCLVGRASLAAHTFIPILQAASKN